MGADPIAHRELVSKLRQFGFEGPRQKGKHPFMIRGSHKLTIPNNHGSDISGQLVDKILLQANISLDEWNTVNG